MRVAFKLMSTLIYVQYAKNDKQKTKKYDSAKVCYFEFFFPKHWHFEYSKIRNISTSKKIEKLITPKKKGHKKYCSITVNKNSLETALFGPQSPSKCSLRAKKKKYNQTFSKLCLSFRSDVCETYDLVALRNGFGQISSTDYNPYILCNLQSISFTVLLLSRRKRRYR